MEIRYNAIILKKKEVGETDRLYTLYTQEQGKVQVVAKGVRKPEAKLAGQLETLMEGLVIVAKGKGMGKIAGAVSENIFVSLRTDHDILKRVLDAAGMFERLVDWEERDPELYDLLSSFLLLADEAARKQKKEKVYLLSEAFLFQVFSHLGYRIETAVCARSGERLRTGEQYFFSPSEGGILTGQHRTGNSFAISENAIKIMRLFLTNRLETLVKIQPTLAELNEIRQVTLRFYQWIIR